MNKFAFVDCTTVDEALGQLGDGATVKAGGIDLLDLMKDEHRFAIEAREYPQYQQPSRDHRRQRWPAPWAAVYSERDCCPSGDPEKLHSAGRCCRSRRYSAGTQYGDAWRQHHAAPALLVLSLQRLRLQEEERLQRRLSRAHRREPIPRHHEQ